MKFDSVDQAARQLADALAALPLRHRPVVLVAGPDAASLGERVAALLGAPVEASRVEHLPVPWYPRMALGALTADNHHYIDPVVVADHSLGAREIAQLCRDHLPSLREPGWRKPQRLGEVSAIVVARALSTGYRALALVASARAAGAPEVIVAAPCGARDALERIESAARLVVLAPSDGPRFDADECWSEGHEPGEPTPRER